MLNISQHRFIAPGPNDIRGPCAGLNAAANHGYISRNGIVDANDIINGLFDGFRLANDATIFLETATRFFDGNPITGEWTIGYASKAVDPPLADLLGHPTGICDYGHLKTEGDSSITRGDFLAPTQNSNCASYPNFVEQLFATAEKMNPKTGWLTPRVFAQHQYDRKQYSIANNPNYFSPAYAGVAFTFGAHMFAYELLSNHSAEYPRGFMTQENFLSLWSYKRKNGKLQYTYGHERIPDNYYKRSSQDQWDLADIVLSTAQQCEAYPTNCQVGGNTGKVNSFSGVDVGDTTGGLVNSAKDLQDPARMGCFISQAIQADVPGFLDNIFEGPSLKLVQSLIPKQLLPALAGLGSCPNMPKGKSIFAYGKQYPGMKMMKTDGPRATEH